MRLPFSSAQGAPGRAQTPMVLLLHLFHKTENRRRNKQSSKQSAVVFFLPETHKQIFDNTKQTQQPRQETQTTVPPDPPRFRTLSPKRQSAAAKTCTRANSTTSQKIVQYFLQKKNELKIHGGLDEKAGATHARLRRRPGQERPIGKSRVGSFRFSMCSCGPCKKKWHRSSFQMFGHYRSVGAGIWDLGLGLGAGHHKSEMAWIQHHTARNGFVEWLY